MFLPCRPCCGGGTCTATDKPYQDTATATRRIPVSGSWGTGVSWGTSSSGPEVFYFSAHSPGSAAGSVKYFDLENPCNWWSVATTDPPGIQANPSMTLTHRATRLPGENDIVHIYDYSPAAAGFRAAIAYSPVKYKSAYCWGDYFGSNFSMQGDITTTDPVFDGDGCSIISINTTGTNGIQLGGTFHGPGVKLHGGRVAGRVNGFVHAYVKLGVQGPSLVTGDVYLNGASGLIGDTSAPPTAPDASITTCVVEGVVTGRDNANVGSNSHCKGGVELYDSATAVGSSFHPSSGPWLSKTIDLHDSAQMGDFASTYAPLNWIRFYGSSELRDRSYITAGAPTPQFYGTSMYRATGLGKPAIPASVGAVFNDDSGSNYTAFIAGYGTAYCVNPTGSGTGGYLPTCNTTAPTYAVDPAAVRGCG